MRAKKRRVGKVKKVRDVGPSIIHMPSLGTVLMVEDTIKRLDYYPTKNQLWRALPKAVMWQTFNVIIDYLLRSNKILVCKDGKIMWIFADSAKARKTLEESVPYNKIMKAQR